MKKTYHYIPLLLAISFVCLSCNQSKSESGSLTMTIDSLLVSGEAKPFNGIILIAKAGKTEYLRMMGHADPDKKTTPFKTNDQFVVGSVSKQFTAAVVLREYDSGRLDLQRPIGSYLPNLPASWADTITTHHLITHTHGIVSLDKPTLFPAGTQYDYSQIGFDLLAQIAEKTSGKSFIELTDELFKECSMPNTFHPEKKDYHNLVKGYEETEEGTLEYTDKSLDQYPAAGAFISSAEDLAVWNQLFFEGKLFNVNIFTQMTTKQENAIRNHPIFGITYYGYGITVDDEDDVIQWGQTGYAPGFASLNFYFPQSKRSVIVLENVIFNTDDTKKTFYYHAQILKLVRNEILRETNNTVQ